MAIRSSASAINALLEKVDKTDYDVEKYARESINDINALNDKLNRYKGMIMHLELHIMDFNDTFYSASFQNLIEKIQDEQEISIQKYWRHYIPTPFIVKFLSSTFKCIMDFEKIVLWIYWRCSTGIFSHV